MYQAENHRTFSEAIADPDFLRRWSKYHMSRLTDKQESAVTDILGTLIAELQSADDEYVIRTLNYLSDAIRLNTQRGGGLDIYHYVAARRALDHPDNTVD